MPQVEKCYHFDVLSVTDIKAAEKLFGILGGRISSDTGARPSLIPHFKLKIDMWRLDVSGIYSAV
jgi:hypothetical protein